MSLSPDGKTLAVSSVLGVEIADVATLKRVRTVSRSGEFLQITTFTPDGRFLVVGSSEGAVRLWSTATWQPASPLLRGLTGDVRSATVSPDGRTLAIGDDNGALRLFDLQTQQPLGAPLPGVPGRPLAPQFTPDGAALFGISDAGRSFRWDVRPSSWARRACSVAGRTLTRAEWDEVLPGRRYAPACTISSP